MEVLHKPPQWLSDNLPEGVNSVLNDGGWYAVLAVAGLLVGWLCWRLARALAAALAGKSAAVPVRQHLREDVQSYPPPPALTGDRRLTVEGVPVRLRLVVLAPAGRGYDINPSAAYQILEHVLPGLSKIAEDDRPEIRIWPFQLSYQGFANTFHSNTPTPEGPKAPSRWVMAAGRASLGTKQILLGLAMQSGTPTTIGRLRLDLHQWAQNLRIRTRD